MSTGYHLTLGHYNFAGTNKSWNLELFTPYGRVSEMWDEDDKPDVEDLLPSEVLDLIEGRSDSYLFNSRRTRTRAAIEEIREHMDEVDIDWLDGEIARAHKRLTDLRSRRANVGGVSA